jgi:hypothetical protein
LEELRTIADVIRLKQIHQSFYDISQPTGNGNELINQFESHFNYFRNLLEYYRPEVDFEELKWRSDISYQFIRNFLGYYQRKPNLLIEFFYVTKWVNLLQVHTPLNEQGNCVELLLEG